MQRVTTESPPSLELIFFFNVLHLKPGSHPHANRTRVSDLFRISGFPICPTNHSLCNNSAFVRPNYSQNSKAPWQENVSHKSKMSSQSGLIPISPVRAEMRDNVWQNDTPGVSPVPGGGRSPHLPDNVTVSFYLTNSSFTRQILLVS